MSDSVVLDSSQKSERLATTSESDHVRQDLMDAQVRLLTLGLERLSGDRLAEAVDRLIECSLASFREEEALMARLGGVPDSTHRRQHETVIEQLRNLRIEASHLDRSSLLARLIHIDRELIAHVTTTARFR